MEQTKGRTVNDWLIDLSQSNQSNDLDAQKMQAVLRKMGYPDAICVLGIVYLEGKGTIEAPPMSIHQVAGLLLKHL